MLQTSVPGTRKMKFESYFKNSYKRRGHLPFRSRCTTRTFASYRCGLGHIFLLLLLWIHVFFIFSKYFFVLQQYFILSFYLFFSHTSHSHILLPPGLLLRSVTKKKKSVKRKRRLTMSKGPLSSQVPCKGHEDGNRDSWSCSGFESCLAVLFASCIIWISPSYVNRGQRESPSELLQGTHKGLEDCVAHCKCLISAFSRSAVTLSKLEPPPGTRFA